MDQLQNFISKNKHLPGIPTAKEVRDEGIELGEMNAKLLQKIEELHLYILVQENKMKEQQKVHEGLQQQIDELKVLMTQKLR